jgi:hypothetical protein
VILEGILTTIDCDGRPHVAPMGATVDDQASAVWGRMLLRPFRSSMSFRNLERTGEAVFHVTDDVLLLARAALGSLTRLPPLRRAASVDGWIVADACRWYELRVARISGTLERADIETTIVDQGRARDFLGFNRAKHAVVEGAILATRVGIVPDEEIVGGFQRLAALIEKTGGPQEREAWQFLSQYIRDRLGPDQ